MQDRIPLVNSRFSAQVLRQEPRLVWSFWVAAGLAAAGGAMPFLVGGSSSRISNVYIPYAIGAVAFGAAALWHDRGRAVTGGLYFVAGLALVFGMLTMFAFPLELAALGTCPAPPEACTSGLQRPLTINENTGIGFAAGFAFAALFVGFLGLMVVYRRHVVTATAPPVRSIPPVASSRETSPIEPSAAPAAPTNGAKPAVEEPELELPAHEQEDRPELPPHESSPPTT